MTTASVSWDFATDLSPSSSSLGMTGSWSGMDATPTGWDSSGAFYWLYQSTTTARLVVGPPSSMTWTPTSISFKVRRNISGTVSMNVSWGGDYTVDATVTGVTSTYTTKTVDLSSIGPVTGPIELRFWGPGSSGTTRWLMDDVTVTGDVVVGADQTLIPGDLPTGEVSDLTIAAPVSQSLYPMGVSSGLIIPNPGPIVIIQPINLSPDSIISGEAFGDPVVFVIDDTELAVDGVPSSEDFGVLEVAPGASVPVVPYPTAEAVSEFLTGSTVDERLVAMAAVHVGVVTHFARVYTRGNGFYVDGVVPEVASVILAATARLASNPGQIDITIGSVRRQGSFKGWTLAEQKVLNPYRKVAQ